MAKLLLCHPLFLSKNPDEQAASSPYFPLGILYLAAYVREQNHQVAIFDGTFKKDESAFLDCLHREQPDMVGISMLQPTRNTALTLAQMAQNFGAFVILGGPEPTKEPCRYLVYPQIDLVVHHEGEQTLVALLDLLDRDCLNWSSWQHELGIAYRDKSDKNSSGHEFDINCIVNHPRPPIADLDELPTPARDLIDMERYLDTWQETNGYASMTIATSRGCPYGCEWCQDAVHGIGFRQRSPESVAAEVKQLKELYKIDRLRIVDDVDGIDREWIEEWADIAQRTDAVVPFEALYDLTRQDLPMLDVRDSL